MLATRVDVILVVGIALASFVYLSAMMKSNWLPVLVFEGGPKRFMDTNLRKPAGGNNSSFVWWLNLVSLWGHAVQLLSTLQTSITIWNQ